MGIQGVSFCSGLNSIKIRRLERIRLGSIRRYSKSYRIFEIGFHESGLYAFLQAMPDDKLMLNDGLGPDGIQWTKCLRYETVFLDSEFGIFRYDGRFGARGLAGQPEHGGGNGFDEPDGAGCGV